MRKVLGILTEDFRLYHDLVAALKARDLPFTSLSFARRVPDAVRARHGPGTRPVRDRRVRIGRGDPTNRDRILRARGGHPPRGEVADEAGRTHRTARPAVAAAIATGKPSGRRVDPPVEIRPT